jgi:hypothetical protein
MSLPIFTSPCYMCKHFRPEQVSKETIKFCQSIPTTSFDCLEKEYPFDGTELIETVNIHPSEIVVVISTPNHALLIARGWKHVFSNTYSKDRR